MTDVAESSADYRHVPSAVRPHPAIHRSASRATSSCHQTASASCSSAAASGDDPVNCLYVLDVATGDERLIADPSTLLDAGRSRRRSAGRGAGPARAHARDGSGITTFATDKAVTVVAFPLAGRLFVAGLISGVARELDVDGPVFDPRPDPGAARLAYVCGSALRIAELDGSSWELASDEDPDVSWGVADFIAGEEMHRFRGYWWSPDGAAIAACRVDVAPVERWYIADPAAPDQPSHEVRYPAAGTANAVVELHVLALDGGSIDVAWDRDRFPYLTAVHWVSNDRLLLAVQSRDQRDVQVLEANPTTGDTAAIFADHDDTWVELVPGTPDELDDGRLVMAADREGARRLLIDGQAVTPTDLQVRAIAAVRGNSVIVHANHPDDATVPAGVGVERRRTAYSSVTATECTQRSSAARRPCCAACRWTSAPR